MSPADAETAFAHVAGCDRCRVALDSERAASAAVATPSPDPTDDFMARLLGIPAAEAAAASQAEGEAADQVEQAQPRPAAYVPAQAGPSRPAGAAGVRPAVAATSTRPASRRRRARVAVGSAIGAAAVAVAVTVGGSSAAVSGPAPSPSIAPMVDVLTSEHSVSTQRMPFAGPQVMTVGFSEDSSSARP
jgi:hypothetical protein